MSDISTVYDAIVTRMGTLLPNHKRITDPYDIEKNNEQFLNQGWGLALGPSFNGELFLSQKLTYQRNFVITITRKAYSREFDVESKATTEKLLMEDIFTVTSDFTVNSTLSTATNHVTYLGDSGIQKIFTDKDQYLMTQIEIQSTIIEHI